MRVQGRKLNLGAVLDWDPETRRCMVVVQVGSRPNPGSAISQAEVECAPSPLHASAALLPRPASCICEASLDCACLNALWQGLQDDQGGAWRGLLAQDVPS